MGPMTKRLISHAPTNVGKAVAESIVVEFKNRQRVR